MPIEQVTVAIGQFAAKADLRNRVAGEHNGDENGRHHVGKNQDAKLGYLGVGNAFHTAQNGIKKHDNHPDNNACLDLNFQEAGEYNAHAPHLPGHIGK
jgi:hypothetical protein